MENVRAVIFDLDGTIYEGSRVIEGAPETVSSLRDSGIGVFFMTNNSSRRRGSICGKLNGMGIDCSEDDIYTSGSAAVSYLADKGLTRDVYILGSDDLRTEASMNSVDVTDDDSEARTTLIGYSPGYTYEDISKAMRAAINSEKLIVCNRDRTYPGDGGLLYPGCGYVAASIEWCSGKEGVCIGKPNTIMLDILCRENGLDNESVVLVGDTFETDIRTADDYCARSILIGDDDRAVCVKSIADVPGIICGR